FPSLFSLFYRFLFLFLLVFIFVAFHLLVFYFISLFYCSIFQVTIYRSQVEKVKSIEKFITEDIEKHYTLDFLAKRFDISLTSMKNCFKAIYGNSIYSYIRVYRINQAAIMLRHTKKSIAFIAGDVGYESPSKFSVAFKDIMGKTPLEYRKSFL
ncbi:MAG: hypothetical protein PWP28_1581, partial [Oceanotoga sp.]|uniref:helix-turn-helix domain-containing protein n=1 Tax=Oceanotoga sp. TaxID=2108366 RepID=UPI00264F1342